jgi:hypothetical protein
MVMLRFRAVVSIIFMSSPLISDWLVKLEPTLTWAIAELSAVIYQLDMLNYVNGC